MHRHRNSNRRITNPHLHNHMTASLSHTYKSFRLGGRFSLLTTLRNAATCSRFNVIDNTQTELIEHPADSRPEDHEVGKTLQKRFGGRFRLLTTAWFSWSGNFLGIAGSLICSFLQFFSNSNNYLLRQSESSFRVLIWWFKMLPG